jgi:kynureninase
VLTGWFAEFEKLTDSDHHAVQYGSGAAAFTGATYDPTSNYRAAAVFDFHRRHELTPATLRRINRHQVELLRSAVERLDLAPDVARVEAMPEERRGGFLAIRAAGAREIVRALRERGVWSDARGDVLRLGPAPYLRDDQLQDAVRVLGAVSGRHA